MQAEVPGETLKGSLESRRWWAVKRKPKSNLLGLKYSSLFEFPPGEVGRAYAAGQSFQPLPCRTPGYQGSAAGELSQ
jgi:hypothetical protein